jgi:hypothetical protein
MVDNQHKQIKGYRDLPQEAIDLMNQVKASEEQTGVLWRQVLEYEPENRAVSVPIDPDRMRTARMLLELGYMELVRAIAQPVNRF